VTITRAQLVEQVQAARARWPVFDTIEAAQGLPRWLLYAVGSRETNLRDVVGDGGHGHGIFQLDDRSHHIPQPFGPELQAAVAAAMRRSLIVAFDAGVGAVRRAISRGRDPNTVTAGGDYGADVLERCSVLQRSLNPPPPPQEAISVLNKPACAIVPTPDDGGYWIVAEDGGVFTYGNAAFIGSEGGRQLNAPIIDAARTSDGKGLWLLGADGGVFTEGSAPYHGSALEVGGG
jgi:hypothetical protein